MYRAVKLTKGYRSLHRFVWRSNLNSPLKDYRMTHVTFGVSASSFAANMVIKQNAIEHAQQFPLANEVAQKCFYIDDCLTGAHDSESALILQQQLACGGFLLRKWNSSNPSVLERIPKELRDTRDIQTISEVNEYAKTLGIQWNISTDEFRLTINQ